MGDIAKSVDQINGMFTGVNTTATESKTEERTGEKKHLEMLEKVEFNATLHTMPVTTNDLCNMVNEFFSSTLTDYEGCIIEETNNPMAPFSLKIYLFTTKEVQPEAGKIKCLNLISEQKAESAFDRMMNFNIAQRNKIYLLTDDAKEVLSDFVTPAPGQKKIDWNKITYEFVDSSVPGRGYKTYMGLYLDIIKFLKFVYGSKYNGSFVDYQVVKIRPLPVGTDQPWNNAMIPNYLIGILRLEGANLKAIANKLGYVSADTIGFPIVRVSG